MKYRIIPYDLIADIWLLQERFMFIFWRTIGVGEERDVRKKMTEMNKP